MKSVTHSHLYNNDNRPLNFFVINPRIVSQQNPQTFYLMVYLFFSLAVCIGGLLKFLSVLVGSIKASKILFEDFVKTIFHAPSRWYDTVPVGRILNRFTADFESVDSELADGMGFCLTMGLQLLSIIIASIFISP